MQYVDLSGGRTASIWEQWWKAMYRTSPPELRDELKQMNRS